MASKYKVIVTPQAARQIKETARYIKCVLCAPMAAEAFLKTIQESVVSLDQFPNRIGLTTEEPWHSYGIHKMVIDNYLVYFWINEELYSVHVVAFARGNRNQRQILEEIEIKFI